MNNASVLSRQGAQVLEHLMAFGSINSVACREGLGVQSPAARVFELRRAGIPISTGRVTAWDSEGQRHLVALYSLDEAIKNPAMAIAGL